MLPQLVFLYQMGQFWPWTDKAHLASEYIDKLW